MRVAITGGLGFLGWHVACQLRARHGIEPVRLGRDEFADDAALSEAVNSSDVILHLAGVNRAETPDQVREGNIQLAERLALAVRRAERPLRLVYANSIQSRLANPYGEGKLRAEQTLRAVAEETGGTLANVMLPNLFGEHGRPGYNSFVATFCDALANGRTPSIQDDKEVPLLHAQAAAEAILRAGLDGRNDAQIDPTGEPLLVSHVLERLEVIRELYSGGEVPPLDSSFDVDLFNTYRSYTFPEGFPFRPPLHSDRRGDLMEVVRSHGGTGQAFVSTTKPGRTRGDHYHLRKVERFFVVHGRAEIRLRRLLHDDVVSFVIDGSAPGFVDMPTMWAHNITNAGNDDLVTVFWADQLLDPVEPDQYPEAVQGATA